MPENYSLFDKEHYNFQQGEVILIDKPLEWTSFDVVNKLRYQIKLKKIGHAGTLDPLATGLLILCTGKMTKQIEQFQAQEKEYTGTLVLGKTTPSIDLETDFDSDTPIDHLNANDLEAVGKQFIGEIEQVPPMYSAIKVGGERLYKKARKGKEVLVKPREVTVSVFELTRIELPEVDFRIVCSKGTYIRSLVRDFGKALGVGAYLSSLRRTRNGAFHVSDAYQINEFVDLIKKNAS
ncbi:tRNA pseudouridine55 synthase [Catalinimonas alkaloidigena]|uniref:tRNA pseudouridine(55) synthase TruB n=1 Tax=Catalinimonas alkaloidigena TaxID=1075417 RepID=UPI0024051BE4|nr:tRNA pseudouridine(55) synthase TruB [Catalinimonas alkaloidigena]MDF9798443.1 tRNA pseudouridine55 synthase [Catalinimonas alkaloidigena]